MIQKALRCICYSATALLFDPAISLALEPIKAKDFNKAAGYVLSISIPAIAVIGLVIFMATRQRHQLEGRVDELLQLTEVPSDIPGDSRRTLAKAAIKAGVSEKGVLELSQIFQEETHHILNNARNEMTKKYEAVIAQKERQIGEVLKTVEQANEKFIEVEGMFKKSESEKKTTEAVVKSISEGLVVVNQKGEVLLMNPSAERILGVKQDKKIGKSIFEDLRDEHVVSMTKEDKEKNERIVEIKSKDENVKKIIRSSSAVIQNEDGQTVGMVNILTDVTKQKELEEIKKQFVSNITHELRTPIVAMRQAITLLLNESAGTINDMQLKFLGIASRNLMQLSQIVEDILDMEKIDHGRMEVKPVPALLGKVVNDVCDTLDPWAKSKELQIVRDVDPHIPSMQIDPDRMTQVMNNLLSNAIKFTPKGGRITVTANMWLDGATVQVSVQDSGCGIAKENLPKLFTRFAQFGDHQGIQGTGLGLCIARDIVEKHGGRIFIESEVKKGSKFYFTMPVKRVN